MIRTQQTNATIESRSILLLVCLTLVGIAGVFWIVPYISSPGFVSAIDRLGWMGPILVIVFVAASHVLAPLTSTPLLLASLSIYGVLQTIWFLYLGSLLSAMVCFLLAKKYGRSLIRKLFDDKSLQKIDQISEALGVPFLIIGRLFGSPIFELISYAAGLTAMPYNTYMLITVICSIPFNILLYVVFSQSDFSTPTAHLSWISMVILTGILANGIIIWFIRTKKQSNFQP